jgi:ATP-binding cassette subfamily C protein CydC
MLVLFAVAAFEAVMPLPGAIQQFGATVTAGRRLFALVDAEPAVVEPPTEPTLHPVDNRLEVRGVRFRYPTSERLVLDGIDLILQPGRRVAVVGATGSGKSTLFSLVLRFWLPEEGVIQLGGVPFEALRSEELRGRIAMVSQNTYLFDATIRENLLIADPEACEARLEQVCRTAQIHEFVVGLPEGYDTWVGETGVRLSGGQARRIAIARALLRNAPILLLDEPTEGLDAGTERALMAAVNQLMEGRSVLLITHRPVALAEMDEILVLDQGRVVARGKHAELLCQRVYGRLLGLAT